MNWLITHLIKEARGRRFRAQDRVRYFTDTRKGKGRGIVLTPSFNKGTVVDFDGEQRRYKVRNEAGEILDIHPRNIIPDSFVRSPVNSPEALPLSSGPSAAGATIEAQEPTLSP
jgi:hypothetical protein